MNQKHLDLSKQFNAFAYDLVQNEYIAKENITSLKNDILFRRVIYNKYYYALYHKYLAYDDNLSTKSGSSKHDAILTKIKGCNDPKLFQVFTKLLNLRIWADYNPENNAPPINLITLNQEIWSIIKRTNINC